MFLFAGAILGRFGPNPPSERRHRRLRSGADYDSALWRTQQQTPPLLFSRLPQHQYALHAHFTEWRGDERSDRLGAPGGPERRINRARQEFFQKGSKSRDRLGPICSAEFQARRAAAVAAAAFLENRAFRAGCQTYIRDQF